MSVALYRNVEFVIIVFILARFHTLYAFTLLHKHIIIEQLKNHLLIKMVKSRQSTIATYQKVPQRVFTLELILNSSQLSREKAQNVYKDNLTILVVIYLKCESREAY